MTQNKYIIAVDLDGTLLSDDKTISKLNRETLKKLEDDGHYVVLCSGRAFRSISKFQDDIGLKRSPMICYNGHRAINRFDPTFCELKYQIPKDDAIKIYLELKDDFLIQTTCENDDTVYTDKEDLFLFKFFDTVGMKIKTGPIDQILDDDLNTFVVRYKEDIIDANSKINARIAWFSNIKMRFWQDYAYSELYLDGVSKSKTLAHVAEFYKIPKDRVLVFGDAPNDVEMLNDFPNSFFMCNGIDGLKHNAKYVTEFDNNHDGVARELIKFFNLK